MSTANFAIDLSDQHRRGTMHILDRNSQNRAQIVHYHDKSKKDQIGQSRKPNSVLQPHHLDLLISRCLLVSRFRLIKFIIKGCTGDNN